MPEAAHPPSRDTKNGNESDSSVVAFPRTAPGRPLHNLPFELSSFVGREQEIAQVKRLLEEDKNRLLTLTGPGGCGKTRLALAVASEMVGRFEGGVWLVELASLSDPELVPQALAQALSVREQPGVPLTDTLADHLREKRLLLVLDNCEHLTEACARLVQTVLISCRRLQVLATSREALGLAGEASWSVPSLSLPDCQEDDLRPVEELARYEAVTLFVERARSRLSTFELIPKNAVAVTEICRKLEGIPLAIELAAARVRALSVEQISERLEDSLGLLTGGGWTALPRHRTLRATLDWSHELLSQEERVLFRSLSVFAGGFTLGAAEAVCAGEGIERDDVLDLLSHLVDKSLVVVQEQQSGEARYRLLETVRQYGRKRLEESGGCEAVRHQHTAWFLALAEEAEPELNRAGQGAWLERLEREHDNLRAALSWALESGDAGLGLRLSGALGDFWYLSGHLGEGRQWLEAALANGAEAPEAARAKALIRAGSMRWIMREHGDYERLIALSEEGLALARKLGDQTEVALALETLGHAEIQRKGLERAEALAEQAVTLQRASGDTAGVARSLPILEFVALSRHDYDRAIALHEESLALAQEAGDDFAIIVSLISGALAYSGRSEHRRARALCEEGLELAWQQQMMHLFAGLLHVSAVLAGSQGLAVRSARLWGAAEALREALGISLSPVERSYYGPHIAAARSQLEEAAWEAAWSEGRTMTPEQAVEYALGKKELAPSAASVTAPTAPAPSYPAGLSPREAEVLKLVAKGLTNAQVAQQLFISPHTVNRHLNSIYGKLGGSSRAAATRFAAEHGLL